MKTPEQMAEEYGTGIDLCCGTSDIIIAAEKGFLAGYKAGYESLREQIQALESQLRQANGMVMKLEAER